MSTNNPVQVLSSQILVPKHLHLPAGSLLAVSLSLCAVAALTGTIVLGNHVITQHQQVPAVEVIVMNKPPPTRAVAHVQAPTTVLEEPAPAATPAPAAKQQVPRNSEYALVFEFDGQHYVAIDTIAKPDPYDAGGNSTDPFPTHGPLRLVGNPEYPSGVVASVTAEHLADDIAAWRDHPLLIDNGCEASVTDFALVGLISGEPFDYMDDGEARDRKHWAEQILAHGNAVIAGRLGGCAVAQGVARSAELPPALPAIAVDNERAMAVAQDRMLSSELSVQAQREFEETGVSGKWWRAEAEVITSRAFRHPRTGQTLISLQGVVDHGCGGANINLWGLYQVEASGAVTEVQIIDAGSMLAIERAIDIDGDGTFEFFAHIYNRDPALISAKGDTLRLLESPFFGCPC